MPQNLTSHRLLTQSLSLALVISAFWFSPTTNAQGVIAITNGLIIDGNGGTPLQNGVVVIRGERIEAVGQTDEISIPDDAQLIDAAGKAVLPGFADMHVHLLGGWDGYKVDLLGYQRYLNALLYSGVTTVLDTGNILPYIQQIDQEIDEGRLLGPKVYFVGPVLDGPDPVWPPISYAITSVSQIPVYIQQLKRAGVDAIKAYGGLSLTQVQSVVAEARKESLMVFVDQRDLNGSALLMRAGVRSFAHVPFLRIADEALEMMANQNASVITTLTVLESFSRRRYMQRDFFEYPLVRNTMPPWFLDDLMEEADRSLDNRGLFIAERMTEVLKTAQENVKRLVDANILVVAGTDSPYPGVFYGEGLHRELELLVEAGLTPLQAITAATKNAAVLMGDSDEWGTLELGKIANVVILNGNPAVHISDSRNIEVVIRAGRILDRSSLEFDENIDPGYRAGTTVGN